LIDNLFEIDVELNISNVFCVYERTCLYTHLYIFCIFHIWNPWNSIPFPHCSRIKNFQNILLRNLVEQRHKQSVESIGRAPLGTK
jgi:hypothetical protein